MYVCVIKDLLFEFAIARKLIENVQCMNKKYTPKNSFTVRMQLMLLLTSKLECDFYVEMLIFHLFQQPNYNY